MELIRVVGRYQDTVFHLRGDAQSVNEAQLQKLADTYAAKEYGKKAFDRNIGIV